MTDYGNPDLYRSPRYSDDASTALEASANSSMWDDWDLSGLLTDLPNAYAQKAGVRYGIFCSTGTAGLHSSLMALELLPGDEVLVPCMTFIRAVTPLVHLGLVPVLADIDPLTGNLDSGKLDSLLTAKTKAIIVVHMWGVPADMTSLVEICQRRGLYLIEDFSHAHFSKYQERTVGTFGDVAYASLQRKKTLSVGEGGLIFTNSTDIYARLQQITSPGSFKGTPNYNEFSGFGLNLRMSPFSGVVAKCLLSTADQIVSDRAAHAIEFTKLITQFSNKLEAPFLPHYATFVSAYGYKPRLTDITSLEELRKLNSRGRWLWSGFTYDHILASPFWDKPAKHYPFALGIRPRSLASYSGYDAYTKNRVSLSVPTVPGSYWTEETRHAWKRDLEELFN